MDYSLIDKNICPFCNEKVKHQLTMFADGVIPAKSRGRDE